jgi:hypothetical protein
VYALPWCGAQRRAEHAECLLGPGQVPGRHELPRQVLAAAAGEGHNPPYLEQGPQTLRGGRVTWLSRCQCWDWAGTCDCSDPNYFGDDCSQGSCPAGSYRAFDTVQGTYRCEPCAKGTYKPTAGNDATCQVCSADVSGGRWTRCLGGSSCTCFWRFLTGKTWSVCFGRAHPPRARGRRTATPAPPGFTRTRGRSCASRAWRALSARAQRRWRPSSSSRVRS